jgi:hypothetical protein
MTHLPDPSAIGATPRVRADRLNRLFRTFHPGDQGEYTAEEVVASIQARGGPAIGEAAIQQLCEGVRNDLPEEHLVAVAECFGHPVAHFTDDGLAQRTLTREVREVAAPESQPDGIGPNQ